MPTIAQINQHWEYLLIIAVVIGLCIGSFLNVVIYRFPRMLQRAFRYECEEFLTLPHQINQQEIFNLAFPHSHCPHCLKPILIRDNIPLFSYLWLRGRCRHCTTPISLRYPFVELLTAIVTAVILCRFGIAPLSLALLLLSWTLLPIIFIDYDHQIIPDQLVIPLIWLGLIVNSQNMFVSPTQAIMGATIGYVTLYGIAKLFKLIRKIDGMGNGDFKLLAVFGAWFGWQPLPNIILAASLGGVIVSLFLMLLKRLKYEAPFPFAPYLAVAGWVIGIFT